MSGYYDTMQVCEKCGKVMTDCYEDTPTHRKDFCDKCGSKTIINCDSCGEKIKGHYHVEGVISMHLPVPPYNCHSCGEAYPWRRRLVAKDVGTKLISPAKYIVDALVSIFKK